MLRTAWQESEAGGFFASEIEAQDLTHISSAARYYSLNAVLPHAALESLRFGLLRAKPAVTSVTMPSESRRKQTARKTVRMEDDEPPPLLYVQPQESLRTKEAARQTARAGVDETPPFLYFQPRRTKKTARKTVSNAEKHEGIKREGGQGSGRGSSTADTGSSAGHLEDTPHRTGFLYVERPHHPFSESETSETSHSDSYGMSFDSYELANEFIGNGRRESELEQAAKFYGDAWPLQQAVGPPVRFQGAVGGMMATGLSLDVRVSILRNSFPISVHPLRLPNTRAGWSSASNCSLADWRFVRLAGLLADMVPVRQGRDEIEIKSVYGDNPMRVNGKVSVKFDAKGYEFTTGCWVVDLGSPVELYLGMDWLVDNKIATSFLDQMEITRADAKKVRDLKDVYERT